MPTKPPRYPLDPEGPPRVAPQSKVFLHCFETPGGVVHDELRHVDRVPVVGDHLLLSSHEPIYRVALVILYAFDSRANMNQADVAAEVWAHRVDKDDLMSRAKKNTLGKVSNAEEPHSS